VFVRSSLVVCARQHSLTHYTCFPACDYCFWLSAWGSGNTMWVCGPRWPDTRGALEICYCLVFIVCLVFLGKLPLFAFFWHYLLCMVMLVTFLFLQYCLQLCDFKQCCLHVSSVAKFKHPNIISILVHLSRGGTSALCCAGQTHPSHALSCFRPLEVFSLT
jgi:hypothetical protein